MSLVLLILSIGWPGAATHRDATIRIAWGDFVEFIAWSELIATALTVAFLILFVRFANRVHREKMLERERNVVPFVRAAGILLLAAIPLRAEDPAHLPAPLHLPWAVTQTPRTPGMTAWVLGGLR